MSSVTDVSQSAHRWFFLLEMPRKLRVGLMYWYFRVDFALSLLTSAYRNLTTIIAQRQCRYIVYVAAETTHSILLWYSGKQRLIWF
jgi:hypothetical protein